MRYSKVYRRIWQDTQFRALDEDSRMLYLYLLTSPHSNMLGYYYLPVSYAAEDLQWSRERVSKGFRNLSQTVSEGSTNGSRTPLIRYDEDTSVVLVTDYLRDNPFENANQVKGALKMLEEVPRSSLYQDFCECVRRYAAPYADRFETLRERFGNPSGTVSKPFRNQEQDQEQDQDQDIKRNMSNEADGQAVGESLLGHSSEQLSKNDDINAKVKQVMDCYNEVFKDLWARPLRLTPDRKAKIKARLAAFTVEEICQAIRNIRASPFHCGANDAGKVYATPEFICRNDGQIDKWLKVCRPREKHDDMPDPDEYERELEAARKELEQARAAYERRVSTGGS